AKIDPEHPSVPSILTITSDTGASSSDKITTDQTLTLSGTGPASATITLYRADLGGLGSVAASANGTYSYDYTATTLAEGAYACRARATDSSGAVSDYSADLLVVVDRTAPTVVLNAPGSTTSKGPVVQVTASDLVGLAANATVAVDVDKNNDGDFL